MSRPTRVAIAALLAAGLVAGPAPAALGRPIPGAAPVELPIAAPAPPLGPTQVVAYDRRTKFTTVVSHDQSGAEGQASSSRPSVDFDGTSIAFESDAALVTGDGNDTGDVYAWEQSGGVVRRISETPSGGTGNGDSRDPSISGDGNSIAFSTRARNLVPGAGLNGTDRQIVVWQIVSDGISLVSAAPDGPGNGSSSGPSISQDGRVVAFESTASNLVDDDSNGVRDVFLRDLLRAATIRASLGSIGEVAADSRRPSLAGDGGAVVFDSTSPALVPKDSNGARDVFVRDLPPALIVAPNPLDFGVVPLQTPQTRTLTVVSAGWSPLVVSTVTISGTNAPDFLIVDDQCTGQALGFGSACAISVLYIPQETGPRTATVSILHNGIDSPAEVSLVGGVPAPQLRLDPIVGPAGVVTVLSGVDLPPGALVTFRWDRGISQALEPVVVGPDGTFSVGVLVFHNDLGGPRQLIVAPAAGGPSFPEQPLAFLVVPGQVQPPGTGALTFLAPEIGRPLIRR